MSFVLYLSWVIYFHRFYEFTILFMFSFYLMKTKISKEKFSLWTSTATE